MALERMLSLFILMSCLQIYFLLITFKYMLMYVTKGYTESYLDLKWLTESTRLSQSIRLPLCCTLGYLKSEADIPNARPHPGFPVGRVYVSVKL